MAKSARISKLVDEKLFHPLDHEKVTFTLISFSHCINSLIPFWSIIVVPSGIKSGPDNEFESLGSQKVDFCAFGKNFTFQWKMGYLFKLKILVSISQYFIILGIGHHFLSIFG